MGSRLQRVSSVRWLKAIITFIPMPSGIIPIPAHLPKRSRGTWRSGTGSRSCENDAEHGGIGLHPCSKSDRAQCQIYQWGRDQTDGYCQLGRDSEGKQTM